MKLIYFKNIKFYSFYDAKKAKKFLTDDYNIKYNTNFHL